jgi:hypothetical protein
MKNICVFGVANGVGISRDMTLIKEVLTAAGHKVELNHPFRPNNLKTEYDMCIYLERFSEVGSLSPINIMIPNPEWFEPGWLPAIKCFVAVFTKTKMADDVFSKLGCQTEYISFTSDDRYLPDVKKDDTHWFHIAGKSVQKQTDIVWKTWEKNPGFPQLTILQDPKFFKPRPTLRNVNFMYDRISEELLRFMQNNFSVHVCPSLTEGFGHYIMEAMSCKSLVITTNAVPMTELITTDRGILVEPVRQEKMRLSLANIISVDSLEKAVIRATIMGDVEKQKFGENARQFYKENDAIFRKNLTEAVNKYLQ